MERVVVSYRLHGMRISENLTLTTYIFTQVKKARQSLCHHRRLRKLKNSTALQKAFYTAAIESVLTGSITTWYGIYSDIDRRGVHRVISLC